MSQQENISISIDGQNVSVPAGSTIMEAVKKAKDLGQSKSEVPHFCWHPGLSVAGVCRFCMVRIEGVPKLQIACNTPVRDGMKVDTLGEDVKEAHKWALEFHLINHPLDCPICDQAGECELQNYYMKVGKYDSQMDEDKVLKPKALDVGDTLVLDTERCILCSRCVRFEDEVTKTSALGIFNRGDRAVIGTYKDRRVTHNYSYNLVDICPVGAFTSKDFRFKCRVWFLKETESICPGCSTGCNVTVFQNANTREYFRLKPRENPEVNGHWMCDQGRLMFEHLNVKARLVQPQAQGAKPLTWEQAHAEFDRLTQSVSAEERVVLAITPQYTNEEVRTVLEAVQKRLGRMPEVVIWREASEDREAFDGILYRGDRNPNSRGTENVLNEWGVSGLRTVAGLNEIGQEKPHLVIAMGPEVESSFPSLTSDLTVLGDLSQVIYFGNSLAKPLENVALRIPTLVFAEKDGVFVNHAGHEQKLKPNKRVMPSLKSLQEFFGVANAGG